MVFHEANAVHIFPMDGSKSEDLSSVKRIRTSLLAIFMVGCLCPGVGVGSVHAGYANLTTSEERDLGEEFMAYVKKRFEFVEAPSIVDYVRDVGGRILDHCASPPFDFQFYVIKEDVYNAFAGPGGHICIYSGLLMAMESEDELAGILAHEIGHVVGRHISKQIEQSKKISLATLAGVVAGVFLGGGAATSAITTGSIAAGQSLSLKYSREHEVEADKLGLKYLTDAGYDGEGLLHILEKIRQKQWFSSKDIPSYLSTHPAVEARLMYLDTWLQVHRASKPAVPDAALSRFEKVRAKLIALCMDPSMAHSAFDAAIRHNEKDVLGHYGKALVFYREGKKTEALGTLRQALALRPLDPDIHRDLGKVYLGMGDYTKALNALKNALSFDDKDTEGRFLLARAYMETDQLEAARVTLRELLRDAPDYLAARYLLGEVFGKLNNFPEAHYHLGLYYKEKGPDRTARFHLQRAMALFAGNTLRQEEIRDLLKGLSEDEEQTNRRKKGIPSIQDRRAGFPAWK